MTEIQLLSHTEQMEAHRRDFNTWWETNILPVLEEGHAPNSLKILSQHQHWREYRHQHHLLPKTP